MPEPGTIKGLPEFLAWPIGRAGSFFDYEVQPKEKASGCDLCGDVHGEGSGTKLLVVVAERDRYGFPVRHWQCQECGLVYQDPRLAPDGLRALYSGPYRALVSAWHGRPINAQTLEPEQREYARKLAEVLAGQGKFTHLLDLGGSTGIVAAKVAAAVGVTRITVVEPTVEEATAAIPRADHVVVQSAEDFEATFGSVDLILLCQTVDHLRSISAVLAKVRTWLAPGGRFFVDAVDWEAVRGDGPAYMALKIDHVYALTADTMERYLGKHGFRWRRVPAPSANHVAYLCEVET